MLDEYWYIGSPYPLWIRFESSWGFIDRERKKIPILIPLTPLSFFPFPFELSFIGKS